MKYENENLLERLKNRVEITQENEWDQTFINRCNLWKTRLWYNTKHLNTWALQKNKAEKAEKIV